MRRHQNDIVFNIQTSKKLSKKSSSIRREKNRIENRSSENFHIEHPYLCDVTHISPVHIYGFTDDFTAQLYSCLLVIEF